ncbi:MAG: hypothetical protein H7240_08330, partial [Glaciimonas sp.]|nr:hypothetical protein [Glaciimonas sp.]
MTVEEPNIDAENNAVVNNGNAKAGDLGLIHLKSDVGPIGLDSVLKALTKLSRIGQLAWLMQALSALPAKWLQKIPSPNQYRIQLGIAAPSTGNTLRLGGIVLLATTTRIIHALIDLLIQVIHKIGTLAEHKVEKKLLNDLRRVRGKTNVLFKLAEAAVDKPDGMIKDVLYT